MIKNLVVESKYGYSAEEWMKSQCRNCFFNLQVRIKIIITNTPKVVLVPVKILQIWKQSSPSLTFAHGNKK